MAKDTKKSFSAKNTDKKNKIEITHKANIQTVDIDLNVTEISDLEKVAKKMKISTQDLMEKYILEGIKRDTTKSL